MKSGWLCIRAGDRPRARGPYLLSAPTGEDNRSPEYCPCVLHSVLVPCQTDDRYGAI